MAGRRRLVGGLVVLVVVAAVGTAVGILTAPGPLDIRPGGSAVVTYCHGQQALITQPAEGGRAAPAVLYLHGGAWVSGTYETSGLTADIDQALSAAGFLVMAANYRLGPANPWPDQIRDATCAVRFLRANHRVLRVATDRIGVYGISAGGHLAALVGTAPPSTGFDEGDFPGRSSRVQAVADLSGPSDLTTIGGQGGNWARFVQHLFNGLAGVAGPSVPASAVRRAELAASPITHASPGDPPFLVVHADDDEVVPLAQSVELVQALSRAGVPVTYVVVHGGGHGLDRPGARPGAAALTSLVVSFFVARLG